MPGPPRAGLSGSSLPFELVVDVPCRVLVAAGAVRLAGRSAARLGRPLTAGLAGGVGAAVGGGLISCLDAVRVGTGLVPDDVTAGAFCRCTGVLARAAPPTDASAITATTAIATHFILIRITSPIVSPTACGADDEVPVKLDEFRFMDVRGRATSTWSSERG